MDLLERAAVLDELDGVLATATTGGRAVLLVGEAGLEGSSSASRGNVWRAVQQFRTVMHRCVALAVHLMTNTAVTSATFDIDGGQQLVEG